MNIRGILAASAVALASLTTGAAAQNYNRIITFGDSLSDNGNLFATTGNPPAPYNRRFTNDLVWAEYMFGPANGFTTTTPGNINQGNINFAFGGARSDLAANSNGPIPGTPTQIGAFLGQGGTFRATDVVSVWAGANNLFQTINPLVPGLQNGTVTSAQAQAAVGASATASAADVGNQVRQLATAGARTILVFNLPSFASTPQFGPTPIAALAGFGSTTFNTALAQQMQNVGGANVISIPVDQIFAAVLANAGGFGLSDVAQQCIQVPACVGNPAARGSFLFWDGVHPTSTGHQIIAASVREYLSAPSRAAMVSAAFGNTALANRRSGMIEGFGQLSSVTPASESWRYFVYATGEGGRASVGQQSATFGGGPAIAAGGKVDTQQFGLRFGGLRAMGGGWTVGVMASILKGDIDGKAGKFEADNTQFGLDLLARWRSQTGSFVNMGLGASIDRFTGYSYRTIGNLVNTGSAQSLSVSAGIEAGHDFRFNALTLTPQARLSYVSSNLDRFTESGVVAPVAYGTRTVNAFGAAAELKLSYNFTATSSAYVLAGYEGNIGKSSSNVTGQLAGNTAQPFSWTAQAPQSPGVVAGAGIAVDLGVVTARASYRGTFGDNSTQRHSVNLGIDGKF